MCGKSLFLTSLVLVLASVSYTWAASNLVAHYKFEGVGDFNNTAPSATSVGTPEGNAQVIWDDDRGSYVLSLDGDGDYVNCGNEDIGQIGTAITVAAWIKTNSLSSSDTVIGKGWAWRLNGGSDGNMRFQVSNTQPAGSMATGSTNVNDGQWHHVAGTYDGTEYNVYVDGMLDGHMEATGSIDTWDGYWFCIGAHFKKTDTRDPRYFWHGLIDDVRVYDGVLSEAEIGEISTIPEASRPSPADGQTDVARNVVLGWKPGMYADKHDVYFGANFDDVSEATTTIDPNNVYQGRQDLNHYAVSVTLDLGKTYYWRIDEISGPPDFRIYKGNVWQFTAEPFVYPIPGAVITATASSQFNENTKPENTINGSGLDDDDLHSTEEAGIWISSMTGPQPTWIQYEFNRVYKLHQMWVWNFNQVIEPVLGFGFKDVTIEYSVDGVNWATLGTTHEFARAPGQNGYAHNTTVDFAGVPAKYVKITANSNWGGVLPQYGLSEVRFFHIPVFAREPDPASGATDADVDGVLSWRAGREAASHNVYISSDEQAVIDETISPVSIPADSSYANYATGPLVLGQSYYWKVNEVNEAETPTTWQGNVWNFITQKYLVVDDFEDYNDFEPDRIFDTWIDGWGDPANGSQVGSDVPPFAEQTIVHSGKQSMPLHYDNSTANYSEATANVANRPVGRDWTKYGITALSLWFHGDPSNAAEQLYVKLNGSKVTYDGAAANLTLIAWQLWNIELASFGVNLSNVTELSIGLERIGAAGGKGVVYIDDIRLYPLQEPEAN